jgi:hypothetical protein
MNWDNILMENTEGGATENPCIFKILFQHLPGRAEENHRTS